MFKIVMIAIVALAYGATITSYGEPMGLTDNFLALIVLLLMLIYSKMPED